MTRWLAVLVATGLLAACGSGSGGTARLVDDTGLPDVEDGGGWVALVPAERIDDLWDATGVRPTDDLRYAAVPLSREQVESVGGVAETVSEDGDFELGLTGELLVCRIPADEAATRGCALVDLAEGEDLAVTSGEGGFYVED